MKRYFDVAIVLAVVAVLAVVMRSKQDEKSVVWRQEAREVMRVLSGSNDVECGAIPPETPGVIRIVNVKLRRHATRPLGQWTMRALTFLWERGSRGQHQNPIAVNVLDWETGQEMRDTERPTPQQGFQDETSARLAQQAQNQLDQVIGPGRTLLLVQCQAEANQINIPHRRSRRRAAPAISNNKQDFEGGSSKPRQEMMVQQARPEFRIRTVETFLIVDCKPDIAAKLEGVVQGALGLDESRGDKLTRIPIRPLPETP